MKINEVGHWLGRQNLSHVLLALGAVVVIVMVISGVQDRADADRREKQRIAEDRQNEIAAQRREATVHSAFQRAEAEEAQRNEDASVQQSIRNDMQRAARRNGL